MQLVALVEGSYDPAPGILEIAVDRPMKRAVTIAGTLALSVVAGCATKPEVDQIAQSKMIGESTKEILACMGAPATRRSIGATEILSFASGRVWIEGEGFGTFGYPRHPACNIEIVLTKGKVSQVEYTGPSGDALDLGERCDFDVARCVPP